MPESTITKQALAHGLKELMHTKSFDKITISDITKECGLNRQSFYYHFQDKYELLNWIFYHEIITVLTDGLSLETWPENLSKILHIMEESKGFYRNALKYSFQEEFEKYLIDISTALFVSVLEHLQGENTVSKEHTLFLAQFFSYGFVGSILTWVNEGMIQSPEEMTSLIVSIVNDCKAYAAKRYIQEHSPL